MKKLLQYTFAYIGIIYVNVKILEFIVLHCITTIK